MADFARNRETPRRGIPGMTVGRNQDVTWGFSEEKLPFGTAVIKGTEKKQFKIPVAGTTLAQLKGFVEWTHLVDYPVDDSDPAIPVDEQFSLLKKTKIWLPAETGLDDESAGLFYQLTTEGGRDIGKIYSTASTTATNSIDVSSILSVFEPEEADDMALFELFMR